MRRTSLKIDARSVRVGKAVTDEELTPPPPVRSKTKIIRADATGSGPGLPNSAPRESASTTGEAGPSPSALFAAACAVVIGTTGHRLLTSRRARTSD